MNAPLAGETADEAAATVALDDAKKEVAAERERIMLHMPVDVRSASLVVLAVLASVYVLRWAADVFIPLMLSLMAVYALSPVVERLVRWHIPRAIAAALVLLAIGGATGSTGYVLADSAGRLVDSLPVAAQKLRQAARNRTPTRAGTLDTVQQAAAQLEQAAEENSAKVAARKGVARVVVERPSFNVRDYLWSGTVGLLGAAGQLALVAFLT
ncbi:MAG: AI-2E family transporter, partial [Comamonadaceae bacterium]